MYQLHPHQSRVRRVTGERVLTNTEALAILKEEKKLKQAQERQERENKNKEKEEHSYNRSSAQAVHHPVHPNAQVVPKYEHWE